MTEIITSVGECAEWAASSTRMGRSIGLVPTLGALHEGHLSLVRAASQQNDVVVVSIFVNPLQFGSADDLARYPRSLDRDIELASSVGATVVFVPSNSEMFPEGEPQVTIDPGPFGSFLEGASRPGHFRGVATVVAKFFSLTRANRAYFGEKDYEQLTMVRRLVTDLSMPVEIIGMPIVRESDGLAMSSRNQRLDDVERAAAAVLYRALQSGAAYLTAGGRSRSDLEKVMAEIVNAEGRATLDYATVRHSSDLSDLEYLEGPLRLLVAAHVGPIRLIDNLAFEL